MSNEDEQVNLGEPPLFIQQIVGYFLTRASLSPEEIQFIRGENYKGEDSE